MATSWEAVPNPVYQVEYGQDSDGALVFAVRVTGAVASPNSPKDEALRLCALWERACREESPRASVRVFDDKGALLR